MASTSFFVIITPTEFGEGLTVGGAMRIKINESNNAIMAFANASAAEACRLSLNLSEASVQPVSKLVLKKPDQALVFSSFEDLQAARANWSRFDFAPHIVQLPAS